ncbi:MAG: AAA family ATPase [Desulfobacter sp.]
MAEYFTSDHFKLLNKWQGQKRDESNPEQNRAYDDLKKAYEVTEQWAEEVKNKLFPNGEVKIRKRPTNQANNFFEYNWARIYPEKTSPKELAYTVGIDAKSGFIVKIDTVGIGDLDQQRKIYESIRGPGYDSSPIVTVLSAEEGLQKSLIELVDWSIGAISNFKLSYDDVAKHIGLTSNIEMTALLKHFQRHKDFIERQPKWSKDVTEFFCRLAKAVHEMGFDWYFTLATNSQLRFGEKDKGVKRGKPVGCIFIQADGPKLTVESDGDLGSYKNSQLSDEMLNKYEELAKKTKLIDGGDYFIRYNRAPLWPDDYKSEPIIDEDLVPSLGRKPFNRIYYGPPGTGKTYRLLQQLKNEYTDDSEKEDTDIWLIEQVRSLSWFQVIALILHEAGKPIKVADIVGHKFYQAKAKANGRTENLTQTAWGYLQRHTWSKSTTVDTARERRAEIAVFDKDDNSNWYIVDELNEQLSDLAQILAQLKAGPEFGTVNKRYEFVTFHQSFGYEEFVEGLRPELGSDVTDQVSYDIIHGPLRRLCKRAEDDQDNFYALVIDEINRGNISKIFGELITLIEVDKRAGSKLAEPITLPYSGGQFIVPSNVDFIGSMNTADRSLALVDTALRRRFEFVPVLPDPAVLKEIVIVEQGVSINLQMLFSKINDRIEALYDRDHTIGHAYFTHLTELPAAEQFPALKAVFQNKIIPLLEEYFFEDWQKIRLVLGDNQKTVQFQFISDLDKEADLVKLFGNNHDLDQYAIRSRYRLNPESLDLPQSYIGIYEPTGIEAE